MYEDLIKRLQDFAAGTRLDEDAQLAFDAADAIEVLSNAGSAYGRGWTLGYDAGREESKPRWISVTERLPVNTKPVLIVHRGGVSTGWHNGRYWERGANTNHRPIQTVTHWMPFPEPPKEGE